MRRAAPLALFFGIAGSLHLLRPRMYEAIVPDYLPAHRELVYASGVAELAGAAGVLPGRTRRAAGWWLLATLAAVYPANVHMALNPERYPRIAPMLLWLRLPLQFACGWWVWRAAVNGRAGERP